MVNDLQIFLNPTSHAVGMATTSGVMEPDEKVKAAALQRAAATMVEEDFNVVDVLLVFDHLITSRVTRERSEAIKHFTTIISQFDGGTLLAHDPLRVLFLELSLLHVKLLSSDVQTTDASLGFLVVSMEMLCAEEARQLLHDMPDETSAAFYGFAGELVSVITKEIYIGAFGQLTRFKAFSILLCLLTDFPDVVRQKLQNPVECYIRQLEDESSPKNIGLIFRILPALLETYSDLLMPETAARVALNLFAYFPIRFTDASKRGVDTLQDRLLACMTADDIVKVAVCNHVLKYLEVEAAGLEGIMTEDTLLNLIDTLRSLPILLRGTRPALLKSAMSELCRVFPHFVACSQTPSDLAAAYASAAVFLLEEAKVAGSSSARLRSLVVGCMESPLQQPFLHLMKMCSDRFFRCELTDHSFEFLHHLVSNALDSIKADSDMLASVVGQMMTLFFQNIDSCCTSAHVAVLSSGVLRLVGVLQDVTDLSVLNHHRCYLCMQMERVLQVKGLGSTAGEILKLMRADGVVDPLMSLQLALCSWSCQKCADSDAQIARAAFTGDILREYIYPNAERVLLPGPRLETAELDFELLGNLVRQRCDLLLTVVDAMETTADWVRFLTGLTAHTVGKDLRLALLIPGLGRLASQGETSSESVKLLELVAQLPMVLNDADTGDLEVVFADLLVMCLEVAHDSSTIREALHTASCWCSADLLYSVDLSLPLFVDFAIAKGPEEVVKLVPVVMAAGAVDAGGLRRLLLFAVLNGALPVSDLQRLLSLGFCALLRQRTAVPFLRRLITIDTPPSPHFPELRKALTTSTCRQRLATVVGTLWSVLMDVPTTCQMALAAVTDTMETDCADALGVAAVAVSGLTGSLALQASRFVYATHPQTTNQLRVLASCLTALPPWSLVDFAQAALRVATTLEGADTPLVTTILIFFSALVHTETRELDLDIPRAYHGKLKRLLDRQTARVAAAHDTLRSCVCDQIPLLARLPELIAHSPRSEAALSLVFISLELASRCPTNKAGSVTQRVAKNASVVLIMHRMLSLTTEERTRGLMRRAMKEMNFT